MHCSPRLLTEVRGHYLGDAEVLRGTLSGGEDGGIMEFIKKSFQGEFNLFNNSPFRFPQMAPSNTD